MKAFPIVGPSATIDPSPSEELSMTDDPTRDTGTGADSGQTTDDTFAWTEPEPGSRSTGSGREWLAQLQAMIENITEQAAPVVREVGAKAAELAAVAGEKAGPAAQRAAEFTGQAGQRLALKSRDLAAELRRDAPGARPDATEGFGADSAETATPAEMAPPSSTEPPASAGLV